MKKLEELIKENYWVKTVLEEITEKIHEAYRKKTDQTPGSKVVGRVETEGRPITELIIAYASLVEIMSCLEKQELSPEEGERMGIYTSIEANLEIIMSRASMLCIELDGINGSVYDRGIKVIKELSENEKFREIVSSYEG